MSLYIDFRDRLLNGFGTNFYLKDTIEIFDNKDCVDALHNAQALVRMLELKVSEVQGKSEIPFEIADMPVYFEGVR